MVAGGGYLRDEADGCYKDAEIPIVITGMDKGTEEEITKEEFKALYFEHSTPNSGWTAEYWNRFYEDEEGKRYFVTRPETSESTRMFLVSGGIKRRIVFLTVDAEESFFDFPGKD